MSGLIIPQEDRPVVISVLDFGNPLSLIGAIAGLVGFLADTEVPFANTVALRPRPEEINYQYPARATMTHTLGGAWVDDFGLGVATCNIHGITRWRGMGEIAVFNLMAMVVDGFHKTRDDAAKAGRNPDDVCLFLVDTLHWCLWRGYPTSLQISKSKSHPLLYSYSMSITCTKSLVDPASITGAVGDLAGMLTGAVTDAIGGLF